MKGLAFVLGVPGLPILIMGVVSLVVAIGKATYGDVDGSTLTDGAQFALIGAFMCAPLAWLAWKDEL